jgi:hypothetical protein
MYAALETGTQPLAAAETAWAASPYLPLRLQEVQLTGEVATGIGELRRST